MPVEVKCVTCGTMFKVTADRAATAKYCKMACRGEGKKQGANCKHCGKYFERYKSSLHTMTYCSDSCYLADVKVEPKQKVVPEKYYKECEVCGTTFELIKSRLNKAKTCSKKCMGILIASRYEDARVKTNCLECGKEISNSVGRFERGDGKFCSDVCRVNHASYWAENMSYKKVENAKQSKYKRIYNGIVNGKAVKPNEHRVIALNALIAADPSHPFLVSDIDGKTVLHPDVHVHHIDRNKSNNKLSNLLIVTHSAHSRIHRSGTKPNAWECWPPNPTKW